MNWPIPMEAVSPSPVTPRPSMVRLAIMAPVAMDGMRPCTALHPCDRLRKYAGDFDEQPMPENLPTRQGSTPLSESHSTPRSEKRLGPQPAHRVVLAPLDLMTSKPMWFTF